MTQPSLVRYVVCTTTDNPDRKHLIAWDVRQQKTVGNTMCSKRLRAVLILPHADLTDVTCQHCSRYVGLVEESHAPVVLPERPGFPGFHAEIATAWLAEQGFEHPARRADVTIQPRRWR